MIRMLQTESAAHKLYVLPHLTTDIVQELSKAVSACADFSHEHVIGPKFCRRLECAFLWTMSKCFGLSCRDATDALQLVSEREYSLGSTGIGRGVAAPHTKTPCVVEAVHICYIQFAEEAFDFDSLDGEPVRLFALQLSDLCLPGAHLVGLEATCRIFRHVRADSDTDELLAGIEDSFDVEGPWSEVPLQAEIVV